MYKICKQNNRHKRVSCYCATLKFAPDGEAGTWLYYDFDNAKN